jgi:hypothetical protein
MMLSLRALFGSTISLDLRKQFGDRVELDCFQFRNPSGRVSLGSPRQTIAGMAKGEQ